MDTLSIIVLTAVINALVTGTIGGIVLYRIQKRIDNSYYEYQTKFTINHAKSVETLKTLYQKFIAFNNALDEFISEKRYARLKPKKNEQSQEKHNREKMLADFKDYFRENRLFLPDRLADNIAKLCSHAEWLSLMVGVGLMFAKPDETNSLIWDDDSTGITWGADENAVKYSNPEDLLDHIRKDLKKQAEYLEKMYKLVVPLFLQS